MRLFLFDQRAQCRAVCHVDHMGAVRDLLSRRVGVAVHGDGFHAKALQRDDDFLAQFAAAEQHDAGGGWSERCADGERFHLSVIPCDWVRYYWSKLYTLGYGFHCAVTGVT